MTPLTGATVTAGRNLARHCRRYADLGIAPRLFQASTNTTRKARSAQAQGSKEQSPLIGTDEIVEGVRVAESENQAVRLQVDRGRLLRENAERDLALVKGGDQPFRGVRLEASPFDRLVTRPVRRRHENGGRRARE